MSASAESGMASQYTTPHIVNTLLEQGELMLEVTRFLDLDDIVNLYAISTRYYILINNHYASVVQFLAQLHAPESSQVFAWKLYKSLCVHDPAKRPLEADAEAVRYVPSFRWLRLVLFREKVVKQIIASLAKAGHRLPVQASRVIKMIWVLMDVPLSAMRFSLVSNRQTWSDQDLFVAFLFLVKIDMRFTDPVEGQGATALRKMMFAQRTLTVLRDVLQRKKLRNQHDMLRMYAEWKIPPLPGQGSATVFGVPPRFLGRLQHEHWTYAGPATPKLARADLVIQVEAVRRNLQLQTRLPEMIMWGNLDPYTDEDVWPDPLTVEDIIYSQGDDADEAWFNEQT